MAQTATVQIQMPEMGESVTEGIVLEWHVAEGDFVNEGDTIVEVSTDKVDDEVPVGATLAEMEPGDGEGTSKGSNGQGDAAAPGREAEEAAVDGEAQPPA